MIETNKIQSLQSQRLPNTREYVNDYEILRVIRDWPVSFEIFADDFNEMERKARKIAN
jgi:hypothetical protein